MHDLMGLQWKQGDERHWRLTGEVMCSDFMNFVF